MRKTDRNAPVGVFDSGVGGLTVAREIMRNLPSEKIVYFGDTARLPYGSKSKETITRYSRQIIRFLMAQQVKAIVIACNTASAFALDEVRHEFDIPILGVIQAGVEVAAAETRNKRIGVIGTEGTVGSGIHASYIKKIDPSITVIGKACPLFVPLAEEGWVHDPVTTEVARRYLEPLKEQEIDTLILGCTHYPLLRSTIREVMGDEVRLVNPAYETAVQLGRLLEENDYTCEGTGPEEFPYRFYVSDLADKFNSFANSILPYDVEMTRKIDIEKYRNDRPGTLPEGPGQAE
ncbi:MAG: glutamate racemase [Clostridiales bacterium]|nr:glutamate racemase [Clostridiales bacterium]